MKTSKSLSTFSALALVVASTQMAHAKPAHPVMFTQPKHMINKTTNGLIDNTQNGMGTYTRSVTGIKGDKTVTTTYTFADGKTFTRTSNDIVTQNANGSKTYDITTTGANGKTIVKDETLTGTGTAGDYTLSGTITQANGVVDTIAAGSDKDITASGHDTTLVLDRTNAKGVAQSEALNSETLKSGDASANIVNGTGFTGQVISRASLRTTNDPMGTNIVDNTLNGEGTYTISSSQVGGSTTLSRDNNFANGASQDTNNVITQNPDGSTTYNRSATSVSAGGVTNSSSSDETYTSNSSGGETINGTFTQSNKYSSGTVAGTDAKTNYGYDTNVTYTDGSATKTNNTQTLTIGDAVLNVNTGTTFTGASNNSASLSTGQAAQYVALNHPESGQ